MRSVGNSDLAKCAAFVLLLPDGLQGDLRLAQRMAAQLGGQLSHHAVISTGGRATVTHTLTSVADPDPKDPYVIGLPAPDPDPLVRDTDSYPDPAPDPYIKSKKNLDSYCFVAPF